MEQMDKWGKLEWGKICHKCVQFLDKFVNTVYYVGVGGVKAATL